MSREYSVWGKSPVYRKPGTVFRIKTAASFLLSTDLHDYKQTVFLAGESRSGTTWVQDIINYDNSYRIMFEPFWPQKVPVIRHWNINQYLRPDNRHETFFSPAKDILAGKINKSLWVDQFNTKLVARKRLIKDIRANLLLKWIKTNFPEIPIILVLRHPCAVAHSKLKLGWKNDLEEFLNQPELMEDFLHPFKNAIQSCTSDFETYIFFWCIQNYVPLKQFTPGEMHLVFYENLCTDPERETRRLFSFLERDYRPEVMEVVERPSALSRKGESAIITGDSLVDSWRRHITDEQIRKAMEILSMFGLQKIYNEGSLPLMTNDSNHTI